MAGIAPTLPQSLSLAMFAAVFAVLMLGFPVAFTLLGTAVAFATLGAMLGVFDFHLLSALPLRIVGLMENDLLQAIPLFLYLGVVLERTTLAADLLEGISGLFGRRAGGIGIASFIIGALFAPMTGAVGATVLTIGLLALPIMLQAGYDRRLASGIVCSAGTLGTILPPSIVLILLGSVMQGATIEAQLARGVRVVSALTIQDIYLGSLAPALLLLVLYISYVAGVAIWRPKRCPPSPAYLAHPPSVLALILRLFVPLALILLMLASIITGLIYTVEAAASGAVGATIYALARGQLNVARLSETVRTVMRLTAMVFMLLIGATTFSLVFRGFEGDLFVTQLLGAVPGGTVGPVAAVMAICFGLGFFLDALEIVFLVVPIAMPPLLFLGVDPVWLAVLTAINLQTSFLHPPFGFALFFVRGVAPKSIATSDIYFGVIPFLLIQVVILALVWMEPRLVTTIPRTWNAPPTATTTPASPAPDGEITMPEPPDYGAPDSSPPNQR
jgi:tripartite ATP-independent transporter DctM subunit